MNDQNRNLIVGLAALTTLSHQCFANSHRVSHDRSGISEAPSGQFPFSIRSGRRGYPYHPFVVHNLGINCDSLRTQSVKVYNIKIVSCVDQIRRWTNGRTLWTILRRKISGGPLCSGDIYRRVKVERDRNNLPLGDHFCILRTVKRLAIEQQRDRVSANSTESKSKSY